MRMRGNVSEFAIRIENKQHLFDLPELDEREFEFMLAKAKEEAASVSSENVYKSNRKIYIDTDGMYSFVKRMIISPRMAAVLAFAILVVSMLWYSNGSPLLKNKATTAQNPSSIRSIDKNTRIPIENDNVMVISTYMEKHF